MIVCSIYFQYPLHVGRSAIQNESLADRISLALVRDPHGLAHWMKGNIALSPGISLATPDLRDRYLVTSCDDNVNIAIQYRTADSNVSIY